MPRIENPSAESRLWLSGTGRKEEWGVTANRYRVSVWHNENILELDSDDGCTTL